MRAAVTFSPRRRIEYGNRSTGCRAAMTVAEATVVCLRALKNSVADNPNATPPTAAARNAATL